jgi:hypothetical protein
MIKGKMKVFVPVSDKYIHLMPTYAKFFNKYWGDHQDVYCLVNKVTIGKGYIPDNFYFVDIGPKWSNEPWTNALIDYFKSIDDEYFVLTLEDHFLIRPMDFLGLHVMEQAIAKGQANKAMIHAHLNDKYGYPWEFLGYKCVKLMIDAPYRTSIHPAIWRRELFLKWAKPYMTVQEFELNQQESKTDGSVVVSWPAKTNDGHCLEERGDNIFNIHNVYRSGQYQKQELMGGYILPEDRPWIYEMMGTANG